MFLNHLPSPSKTRRTQIKSDAFIFFFSFFFFQSFICTKPSENTRHRHHHQRLRPSLFSLGNRTRVQYQQTDCCVGVRPAGRPCLVFAVRSPPSPNPRPPTHPPTVLTGLYKSPRRYVSNYAAVIFSLQITNP